MLTRRILSFCVNRCRHVYRTPEIGECWNSTLLGWEVWLTQDTRPYTRYVYHVEFGSPATKGVRKNRKEPQNWRVLGPRPSGRECGLPFKNKPPPHVCYDVKFGGSASKGVCINRRERQNWGALGPRPLK